MVKCFFFCLQAAKETGALQAAKSKLEKEVEELTWRLQLEKRMRVFFFSFYDCVAVSPFPVYAIIYFYVNNFTILVPRVGF